MSSSSFMCKGPAVTVLRVLDCVFWIRNTMRNVTIVVPVLTTSCQVSEKPNSGPLAAHTKTTQNATRNAAGEPTMPDTLCASLRNSSFKANHLASARHVLSWRDAIVGWLVPLSSQKALDRALKRLTYCVCILSM